MPVATALAKPWRRSHVEETNDEQLLARVRSAVDDAKILARVDSAVTAAGLGGATGSRNQVILPLSHTLLDEELYFAASPRDPSAQLQTGEGATTTPTADAPLLPAPREPGFVSTRSRAPRLSIEQRREASNKRMQKLRERQSERRAKRESSLQGECRVQASSTIAEGKTAVSTIAEVNESAAGIQSPDGHAEPPPQRRYSTTLEPVLRYSRRLSGAWKSKLKPAPAVIEPATKRDGYESSDKASGMAKVGLDGGPSGGAPLIEVLDKELIDIEACDGRNFADAAATPSLSETGREGIPVAQGFAGHQDEQLHEEEDRAGWLGPISHRIDQLAERLSSASSSVFQPPEGRLEENVSDHEDLRA